MRSWREYFAKNLTREAMRVSRFIDLSHDFHDAMPVRAFAEVLEADGQAQGPAP
jgi:hypothetical protein